jgi:adenylate cyclase
MVWTFIVAVTQFMLQVNDKFGPGNMWKIFIGKYYIPKEELRVFMFLDLKSSTTIAEKFGHQQYYLFLNDFYALISDPIINRDAEIYQYVGDEIVVSWTAQKAIKDLNCLHCFFDIKSMIEKHKNAFQEKFGEIPAFKAGIHFGPVTVGEIGIIKRDIVFTGDVLNTTARIQASCNALQTDLLVSENTLTLFDNLGPFEASELDEIELRGKEKRVKVFTLKLKEYINK